MSGSESRECQYSGDWTDEQPTCEPLSSWSSCGATACTTNEPGVYSACMDASWLHHTDDDASWLTVELRREIDPLPEGYEHWLGFGFSRSGKMCGSDLTTAFFSLKDGRLLVEDRFGNASGRPEVDIDQNQVQYATGSVEDGVMLVRFSRFLDGDDVDDVGNLAEDPAFFIMATGVVVPDPGKPDSHGRLMYHDTASWSSPSVVKNFTGCVGCPPLFNQTANGIVRHPRPSLLVTGAVAEYECQAGQLIGNKTRVCQQNGSWTGDDPLCAIPCFPRVAPADGSVVVDISDTDTGSFLGDIATFSCNSNFSLCGNESITCEASGLWSSPDAVCLLFCDVQEVYFGNGTFNTCIDYTLARENKPLIAYPLELNTSKLGSKGWKQVEVTLSQMSSETNEEIRRSVSKAVRDGRITADEGRDVAIGVAETSNIGFQGQNTAKYTFERHDGQFVDLKSFMLTLFYFHFSPEDFETRLIQILVTDIYGVKSPVVAICVNHVGINDDSPDVQSNITELNFTEGSAPQLIQQISNDH
eukprot:m.279705 g.279705  ORF g.279705 m.279705 type:complete len:529 (+) comp40624_c1_seq33:1591-3177(+)